MIIFKRIRYLIVVTAVAFAFVILMREPVPSFSDASLTTTKADARSDLSGSNGEDGVDPVTGAAVKGDDARPEAGVTAAMGVQKMRASLIMPNHSMPTTGICSIRKPWLIESPCWRVRLASPLPLCSTDTSSIATSINLCR